MRHGRERAIGRSESGVDNFQVRYDFSFFGYGEDFFNIYVGKDNPIVCGCRVGYGSREIRWIWIIR